MSYFDQPLIHDLRDMVSQGWLGDMVHCYARLMHKGGMMWSDEALRGQSHLARVAWQRPAAAASSNWRCTTSTSSSGSPAPGWCAPRASPAICTVRAWKAKTWRAAVFEMDSGAMITLDTAWCANGEELSVHGTLGRFHYRDNRLARGVERGPVSGTRGRLLGRPDAGVRRPPGRRAANGGHAAGVRRHHESAEPASPFLEAVRDGRPAPVSIAAGVRDMRVVAALYESARTGRAVEVA